jgi:protein-S-isoprenylcysteine O-methyltransferase Ste14
VTPVTAAVAAKHSSPATGARTGTDRRLLGWLFTTTALASMAGLFAIAHWQYWRRTGDPKGASFACEEILVVAVAIARRRPNEVSRRVSDWVVALLGSFAVLMLRPGGHAVLGLTGLWVSIQVVGAACAIVCLARLGRSFGVVAANRGVKNSGPYRLVRHPLYASYVVAMLGYLLAAPTGWNLAVSVVALGAQFRRIAAEETVLARNDAYRAYMSVVRWRLIPHVF